MLLASAGYAWWGEYGLTGRRYFTRDEGGVRIANVHVYEGEGYQIEDPDGVWVQAKPTAEWKNEKVKYPIDDVKAITGKTPGEWLARKEADNQ